MAEHAGLPRVSPPTVFPQVTRASKPPDAAAGSSDAYRQTSFVLGEEVDLVLDGLRLEGSVVEALSGSKFRNQPTAGGIAFWSRSWLTRIEALHALEWGNYGAGLSLLLVGAELAAATVAAVGNGGETWLSWLGKGGVRMLPDERATAFEPSEPKADSSERVESHLGETIAVLRLLTDSGPAATALMAAADSDSERTMVTFGDRDFHLALAEIELGLLLELSEAHLRTAGLGLAPALLAGLPEGADAWAKSKERVLARADRSSVTLLPPDGKWRISLRNWRRRPGNAVRKLLL